MLCSLRPLHQIHHHQITMKTLAVLSALVGLAVAAPAPQNGFQPNEFHGLDTADGIHPINFNTEMNGPVVSARSHANPVIVKGRTGYRLYRDSNEERADADPRESCGKQVRVKFCDDSNAKSADLRRSTKNEHMNTHKDEVEDSIKLAKEAVESLQRDLKTIEHDPTGKNAQWKHGSSDKDLHKDIEAARQALEHAETNFGNLESMSLRAATLRDGEELLDINKAKTHEERMAQWKTAMENIQRNVEIARNLEESFKAAEHHSGLFGSEAIDTSKLMRSETHENKAGLQKGIKETASSATSSRKTVEEKSDTKAVETKSEHHSIIEKKAEHFGEDMKSSASELVHVKHQAAQGKSAEGFTNTKSDSSTLKTTHSNIQKAATSLRSTNTENLRLHDKSMQSNSAHRITLNKEINSKTAENTHHHIGHKDESSNLKKTWASPADSQHKIMPHGKGAQAWKPSIDDKNKKHEKSAWSETEHKDTMMKSAEHVQNLKSHEHAKAQGTLDSLTHQQTMKAAEHTSENKDHKIDGEQLLKKSGLSVHSDMRLADSVLLASDINLKAPANVALNHGNLDSDTSKQGKEAELPKRLDHEQARGSYGGGSHHGHHGHDYGHHDHGHYDHGHGGHGFGKGQHEHGYGYTHGHGHHKHGYHGKSVAIDSEMHPSMQMEMNDFSEKSAMENMFQWKHHHDGGRSAYGLGAYGGAYGGALNLAASGGSGAVGVFPHSKVGGCGVPLLLSCSPSVVSGSLIKSHGYAAAAAPAYKSTEESNTKNKRDVIKVKETSIKKMDDVTKSTKTWN